MADMHDWLKSSAFFVLTRRLRSRVFRLPAAHFTKIEICEQTVELNVIIYLFRCTFIVSKSQQTHQFHAKHVEMRIDCIAKLNEVDHQMKCQNILRSKIYINFDGCRSFFSSFGHVENPTTASIKTLTAIESHVEKSQLRFFFQFLCIMYFFVRPLSLSRSVLLLITAFVQMLSVDDAFFLPSMPRCSKEAID